MFRGERPRDARVQQGLSNHLSAFTARTFRLSGAVFISHVQLWTEAFEACPHATDPSVDFMPELSGFVDKRHLGVLLIALGRLSQCNALWPAAPMTCGGARDVCSGVRSCIVSVFSSDTVRPSASKTVTMTRPVRKSLRRLGDDACHRRRSVCPARHATLHSPARVLRFRRPHPP